MKKGILTLEFLLCVLIVLLIIGSFIEINTCLGKKITTSVHITEKIEAIKKTQEKENNLTKYESKSTNHGS